MNPGICYLYEYKNDQKLRNVGFMKVTPHYHSCILQINARGVPVKNGDTVSLLAFYENESESIAKPLEKLSCGEKSIYARLSLTDSEYPGGKILDDLNGFLLRTESGQYYGAFSDNIPFDTDKVKIWEDRPTAEATEASILEPVKEPEAVEESMSVMEAESINVFPGELEETDPLETQKDVEGISENATVPNEEEAETLTETEYIENDNVPEPPERFQELWEEDAKSRTEEPYSSDEVPNQPDEPHETVRKIQRSDLSVLPRKSWNLANNSFLMHCYHNYNHLLLVEEDGHFWLGVPGIYAPREARAAELFGFPQFTQTYTNQLELDEEERDESEKFGYWCRYIR